MANQKITQLTRITSTDGNEQLLIVDSPDTSPVSRSIHVSSLDFRDAVYGALGGRTTVSQSTASGTSPAQGYPLSAFTVSAGPANNTSAEAVGANFSALTVYKTGIYAVDFNIVLTRVGAGTLGASSYTVGLNLTTAAGVTTTPDEHECSLTLPDATLSLLEPQFASASINAVVSLSAGTRIWFTIYQPGVGGFWEPPVASVIVQRCSLVAKRIG